MTYSAKRWNSSSVASPAARASASRAREREGALVNLQGAGVLAASRRRRAEAVEADEDAPGRDRNHRRLAELAPERQRLRVGLDRLLVPVERVEGDADAVEHDRLGESVAGRAVERQRLIEAVERPRRVARAQERERLLGEAIGLVRGLRGLSRRGLAGARLRGERGGPAGPEQGGE